MPTVQVKYSVLLTLSVRQLFYANQICPSYQSTPILDFNLEPTNECQAYMKAKNMVFKNMDSSGGFVVMARTSGTTQAGNDLLRGTVSDSDKLTFAMVLQNPDLGNFDFLPTQSNPGSIYYLSNQVNDVAAVRNNLHLSKAATGVDGNNDQIKKSSANYTFHYAGVVTVNDVKVKHLLTGSVTAAKMVNSANGASDLYFDLSALPSGCCQLLVSNVLTDTFYFMGATTTQQPFGIIELSLSTLLSANYRIVEPDQSLVPARPNYIVLFKNRQTTWRYTIQLLPTSPLYLEMAKLTAAQKTAFIKQLSIAANDSTITFKLSSNTDTSFVFVSANVIALQEKYISSTSATKAPLIISISKYITTPAKEAVVKASLPYPSTSVIDASNLPTIYSDVFITL
jgi:hypothetical protein